MGCLPSRGRKVAPPSTVDLAKQGPNLDELDANTAVDYALRNANRHFSQMELILSCKNLPSSDAFSLPNPFAVVFIDQNAPPVDAKSDELDP